MQAKLSCDLPRDPRQIYRQIRLSLRSSQWPVEFLVPIHLLTLSASVRKHHQTVIFLYVLLRLLHSPCVCSQQISNVAIFNDFVPNHHLFSRLINIQSWATLCDPHGYLRFLSQLINSSRGRRLHWNRFEQSFVRDPRSIDNSWL